MHNTPLIIKLGGAVLHDEAALAQVFSALNDIQRPLVLVHGGGVVVDSLLAELGLSSQKIDGLRVTPKAHIDYVVGALAGISNKLLLAQALKAGHRAVGLCLADANITQTTCADPRLGYVGQAEPQDASLLELLLAQRYLPLISSIGIDNEGQCYNVNADQAALALCNLLKGQLVLLSDVPGVLDAEKQLILQLNDEQAETLCQRGVISEGMAVKVNAALSAAKNLQQPVLLASWKNAQGLAQYLGGHVAQPLGTLVG